jgi:hypothetical protein
MTKVDQQETTMEFQKAVRKRARLRLALAGPSGSGKTHSALLIAAGLGGRIAVIDTERSSASLYSHLVDFDTLELNPPFAPERFIEAIHTAAKAGYSVCVIDSITHEWDGAGGCLEANEELAHAKFKGNTWAAWNETTPRHRAFIDAILQTPMHVIVTLRSKTETVQEGGKVKKLGMKAVQRDGVEYEFTTVLDLEHERHYALATKDRTNLFSTPHVVTTETGRRIAEWLESGAVQKLTEKEVADHKAAITAAAGEEDLKRAFGTAYTAAKNISDSDAMTAFTATYSARKDALTGKAAA